MLVSCSKSFCIMKVNHIWNTYQACQATILVFHPDQSWSIHCSCNRNSIPPILSTPRCQICVFIAFIPTAPWFLGYQGEVPAQLPDSPQEFKDTGAADLSYEEMCRRSSGHKGRLFGHGWDRQFLRWKFGNDSDLMWFNGFSPNVMGNNGVVMETIMSRAY